jgi:hypothetical protein
MIGQSAFEYCGNLESAVIGDGVTTIEMNAFRESENLRT